jgi:cell division septation protein DedD
MHQEFDPRDLEPALPQPEARRRRLKIGPILLALAGIAGFAIILWYMYEAGQRQASVASMPLIKADGGPTKVKPDDPGGMPVPNQDALVLNDPGGTPNRAAGGVEKLLPPAEAPLPRPSPNQSTASVPPAIGPAPTRPPAGGNTAAIAPPSEAPAPAAAPRTPVESKPAAGAPTSSPSGMPSASPSDTQTASVPAVAPVSPKPPVTAARPAAAGQGAYRIQLAAVKTEQAAASEWARIEKANPELAQLNMTPTRVDLGDKGIFYRIQAGPLADAAAADRLCAELKQRKQGCLVVKP